MSESRGDSQPANGGASRNSGSPGSGSPGSGSPGSGSPGSGSPGGGAQRSRSQESGAQGRDQFRASQPRTNGRGRGSARGSDPVADFQRWLMKAGARSMATQVADQVKRTLGAERRTSGDVWDTATNEPPPNEPPECQWCPVCQAARAARMGSAGGLGASLANAGGLLASVVQDAFSAFEQAMKTQEQNRPAQRPAVSPPENGTSDRGDAGQ